MQIWNVDPESPQAEIIGLAASPVRMGGVVIYPTETFYGLGGDPFQEGAVERIYRIKERDFGKPLPLIAADRRAVRKVVSHWPPFAERLAEAFWPGPLTMILPVVLEIPGRVHAFTGKIAIRVTSHPVGRALAEAVGGVLISTSANLSGEPPVNDPGRIPRSFLLSVDGILHAGSISSGTWRSPATQDSPGITHESRRMISSDPRGLPTTVVDLSSPEIRLVRPGCIPWEIIESHLG